MTSGPSRPVIDLDHLAIQTAGDRELERDLLRLFIDQSAIYQARLASAQIERPALLDLLHSVKGSALALGASRLASLAEQVEIQVAGCSSVMARHPESALSRLRSALDEAREFAAHLLQRR